jgi:transposase
MDDSGVPEPVLGLGGGPNSFVHARYPYDRQKRHQLFGLYKRMILIRLAKQQGGFRRNPHPNGAR